MGAATGDGESVPLGEDRDAFRYVTDSFECDTISGSVTATPHPYNTNSANRLHFLGKFCFSNVAPHSAMVTIETKVKVGM